MRSLVVFMLLILVGAIVLGMALGATDNLTSTTAARARKIQAETEAIRQQMIYEQELQEIRLIELELLELEHQERLLTTSYMALIGVAVATILTAVSLVAYMVFSAQRSSLTASRRLRTTEATFAPARLASIDRDTLLSKELALEAQRHREKAAGLVRLPRRNENLEDM